MSVIGSNRKIIFVSTASEVNHSAGVQGEYYGASENYPNAFYANWNQEARAKRSVYYTGKDKQKTHCASSSCSPAVRKDVTLDPCSFPPPVAASCASSWQVIDRSLPLSVHLHTTVSRDSFNGATIPTLFNVSDLVWIWLRPVCIPIIYFLLPGLSHILLECAIHFPECGNLAVTLVDCEDEFAL